MKSQKLIYVANFESKQWINDDCIKNNLSSKFSVKALVDSVAYAISKEDFVRLLEHVPLETLKYFNDSIVRKRELLNCRKSKANITFGYNKLVIKQKKLFKNINLIKTGFPTRVKDFFSTNSIKFFENEDTRDKNIKCLQKIKSSDDKLEKIFNNDYNNKISDVYDLSNKKSLNLMKNMTTRTILLKDRQSFDKNSDREGCTSIKPTKQTVEPSIISRNERIDDINPKLISNFITRPVTSRNNNLKARVSSARHETAVKNTETLFSSNNSIRNVFNLKTIESPTKYEMPKLLQNNYIHIKPQIKPYIELKSVSPQSN